MSDAVVWPATTPRVTEEAGTRGGAHTGIDLAANRGDPVLAAFDGVAVYVGGDGASGRLWLGDRWLYPNGEGRTVDIRRDDGLISRVGHLDGYAIKQGDRVTPGQVVGYAGDSGYSTGVHIHWELRWDRAWTGGRWINPRSMTPITFEEYDMPTADEIAKAILDTPIARSGPGQSGITSLRSVIASFDASREDGVAKTIKGVLDTPVKRQRSGMTGDTSLRSVIAYSDAQHEQTRATSRAVPAGDG